MGDWIRLVQKEPPHSHEIPPMVWKGADVEVGSVWQCACGQLFEVSAKDAHGTVWSPRRNITETIPDVLIRHDVVTP